MKRASKAASPYAVMQRPGAGGPALPNGDPVDPTQRSQPVAKLAPLVDAKRPKPARRHRPGEKSAKRRATSRRR